MNKRICLLALVPVMAPAVAAADSDEGPLLVRVRGVYISPANRSDAIPSLSVPEDAIHVSSKLIPEVRDAAQ